MIKLIEKKTAKTSDDAEEIVGMKSYSGCLKYESDWPINWPTQMIFRPMASALADGQNWQSVLTRVSFTTFRPPSHFPSELSGGKGSLDQNFLRGEGGVRLTIFGPKGPENWRRRRHFREFWQIFEKK